MNTQKVTDTEFKSEELKALAEKMIAAGWKVIAPESKRRSSYFHFSDDGINVGYVQWEDFGGASFSTVHKPNRCCGTGFSMGRDSGNYSPTLEDAKRAFAFAPHWAKSRDREAVSKYPSIEAYAETPMHKIVARVELVA